METGSILGTTNEILGTYDSLAQRQMYGRKSTSHMQVEFR